MTELSHPPFLHSGDATRLRMADGTIALLPAAAGALWFFGWRAGLVLALSLAACLGTEALWGRLAGRGCLRDGSAAGTGLVLGLLLPAGSPWWAPLAGGVLASSYKALSGGLGRNVCNPAALARALLLPFLTPAPLAGAAGPFLMARLDGALGEASTLLLLAGAVYLALRRLLPWAISLPYLAAAFIAGTLLPGGDPLTALCWGGTALGACFLAADTVTSPMDLRLRLLYGLTAGAAGTVLAWRLWGIGGTVLGILLANLIFRLAEVLLHRRELRGA